MAVEWARAFSGGNDIVGIAEFFRPEERADAYGVALELIAFREMVELQLVDVDDS